MGLRSRGAHLVIGGCLTPEKLLTIARTLYFASKVYLVGEIGLKFWLSKNHSSLNIFDKEVSEAEKEAIENLISHIETQGQS